MLLLLATAAAAAKSQRTFVSSCVVMVGRKTFPGSIYTSRFRVLIESVVWSTKVQGFVSVQ